MSEYGWAISQTEENSEATEEGRVGWRVVILPKLVIFRNFSNLWKH